jgi:cytochrome c oxidase subunit I
MNETLGKTHFWMTFAGVYCIFMPMHWLGLLPQSNLLPGSQRATLLSAGASIRALVTVATIWTVSAQGLFVANFFGTLLRRKTAEQSNPWRATTLEWSVACPTPAENFGIKPPIVYRGAYEPLGQSLEDLAPQYLAPELLAQKTR